MFCATSFLFTTLLVAPMLASMQGYGPYMFLVQSQSRNRRSLFVKNETMERWYCTVCVCEARMRMVGDLKSEWKGAFQSERISLQSGIRMKIFSSDEFRVMNG
jgi:hypothetical protein